MTHFPDEEFDSGVSTLTIETVPARDVRLGMFLVFPDGTAAPVEDIEVTDEVIRLITEDMDFETGRSSTCQVLAETEMHPELEFSQADAARIRLQISLAARDRGWQMSEEGAYRDSSSGFQVQVIPVELGAKVRVVDPETFEVFDDSIHADARAAFTRGEDILLGADRPSTKDEEPEPDTALQVALAGKDAWEVDEDDVAWRFCAHDPRYQALIRPEGSSYVSELLYMPSMARVELARGPVGAVVHETEAALLVPHLHIDGLETAVARLRKKLT